MNPLFRFVFFKLYHDILLYFLHEMLCRTIGELKRIPKFTTLYALFWYCPLLNFIKYVESVFFALFLQIYFDLNPFYKKSYFK